MSVLLYVASNLSCDYIFYSLLAPDDLINPKKKIFEQIQVV